MALIRCCSCIIDRCARCCLGGSGGIILVGGEGKGTAICGGIFMCGICIWGEGMTPGGGTTATLKECPRDIHCNIL